MKVSRRSIKLLAGFRFFADMVIITPQSRFFIFGMGNDRCHSSAVVEGRIRDRMESFAVFNLPKPTDTKLKVALKQKYDPEKKVHFFDLLLDGAHEVASFFIDAETRRDLTKPSSGKLTHFRLWRKSGKDVFARPFDGRRYFRESIDQKLETHSLLHLKNFRGESFVAYLSYPTFKILGQDAYDVSVLDNGILIFIGVETGLTYYFRDQRLGDAWQSEIEDTIIADTSLLFDPRRAVSIRHKIKSRG